MIRKVSKTNDPKQFWTSIKKLQGNSNKTNMKYIRDHHNNLIQDPTHIETIFRQHWKDVFRISDEENQNFDQDQETEIEDIILDNRHNLRPYITTDNTRIQQTYITDDELKRAIAQTKQKTPGESGITKAHLSRLPDNMMTTPWFNNNMVNARIKSKCFFPCFSGGMVTHVTLTSVASHVLI